MKNKAKTSLEEKKNNLIIIIIGVSFLGLLAGLAGALAIESYFVDSFNLFPSAADSFLYQPDSAKQADSIIEKAKKIINQQDNKSWGTISLAQNGLVGIFKKKSGLETKEKNEEEFNLNNYYRLSNNIGQGLVITSDGWVLARQAASNRIKKDNISDYIVISKEKKIYQLDNFQEAGVDSYIFLHLAGADNLAVKSFVSANDLTVGQTIIAVNWRGGSCAATVLDKKHADKAVRNSDQPELNVVLSSDLKECFSEAFIFDLDNNIAGIYAAQDGFVLMDSIWPFVNGLLKNKKVSRPSLGVNYSDLSEFAIRDVSYEKGALITADGNKPGVEPKSAAEQAGFLEGDIIFSVNNVSVDVDRDLADLINKYSAGDEIDILYSRNNKEGIVKVKLGELK